MADVFVFPSRYEGRPLALLEAATAGMPFSRPDPRNCRKSSATPSNYIDITDLEAGSTRCSETGTPPIATLTESDGAPPKIAATTPDVGTTLRHGLAYLRLMK